MIVRGYGILIVGLCAIASFMFVVRGHFVNPYAEICKLVAGRIYLEDDRMAEWNQKCRARASLAKPTTRPEAIAEDLRILFSELNISHLEIFNADESRRIWQGQDLETGIDSEFVDGELVIFQIHPGSPAAEAGLRRGDIIASIQGQHPAPNLAKSMGGEFFIRRIKEEFTVNLEPREIQLDESPKITEKNEWAYVRVPSFRSEFFGKREWQTMVGKIQGRTHVLIDLRGNSGGNFVAGLRFLSPFMCGEQEIGYLIKPKGRRGTQEPLADDLEDAHQLLTIDRADIVQLKTYPDYGCLATRAVVLIDSGTASTSELVAQALRDYMGARVLGISSAGQLLVGVWYDLPELGAGWRISIPEAVFQTKRGRRLEGNGVRVDRELYYDLKSLQQGRDGWIEKAVTDFSRDSDRPASVSNVSK